jgi:hypothetical protein
VPVPQDHPSRTYETGEATPDTTTDALAALWAKREAHLNEVRERLNNLDWNQLSVPIYGPEDLKAAVPGAALSFDSWLEIKGSEVRLRAGMDYDNKSHGVNRPVPDLTARLVKEPGQELFELVRSSLLPGTDGEAMLKDDTSRQQLLGQIQAQRPGPTESMPADARGQEVCGYAVVNGHLNIPGYREFQDTTYLVVFTAPQGVRR